MSDEDEVGERTSSRALSSGRRRATSLWLGGAVLVVVLAFLPAWVSYDRVVTNPTDLTVGREQYTAVAAFLWYACWPLTRRSNSASRALLSGITHALSRRGAVWRGR